MKPRRVALRQPSQRTCHAELRPRASAQSGRVARVGRTASNTSCGAVSPQGTREGAELASARGFPCHGGEPNCAGPGAGGACNGPPPDARAFAARRRARCGFVRRRPLLRSHEQQRQDFTSTAQARYDAAVERLTVEEWKRKYE